MTSPVVDDASQQPHVDIQTDVVIVGAGPVGLFQAFQLSVLGIGCQLIDVVPEPGGQCATLYPDKFIYDIPGHTAITGHDLVAQLLAQLHPFTHPKAHSPVGQPLGLHLGQLVTDVSTCPLPEHTTGHAPPNRFQLQTSKGLRLACKAIIVAAGIGAFLPRKPSLEGLANVEGCQVFYTWPVNNAGSLAHQHVIVQGDSDLALATCIALAALEHPHQAPQSITLLHRRDAFTASPELIQQLTALRHTNRIQFVAGQPTALVTSTPTQLSALQVACSDGRLIQIKADMYLPLLGLSPQLGPLQHWAHALHNKHLPVNPATCETQQAGVYAVGDMAHYPGKRKLIVSGFHDATIAAYAIAEHLGGQPLPVQYTTANTQMHARLGV